MKNGAQRRVVVTGMGLITPIGSGKETYWQAASKGVSGVRKLTRFDTESFRTRIAATVEDFNPDDFIEPRVSQRMDRFTQMAIGATAMAIEDSGLDVDDDIKAKTGVLLGSGGGGIISHEEAAEGFYVRGYRHLNPLSVALVMPNAGSSYICMQFGFKGISYCLSTACAAGTHAIGESYQKIKNGYADLMVTGGAEAPISVVHFCAWDKLRAMSTKNDDPKKAIKPFSKNRDGLVMGEGAGIVILESLEHALGRSARILGEIIGYGSSSDAFHLTYPNLDTEVEAMRGALTDAGIDPGEIDYINAHGTATLANDKVETAAIKQVFGNKAYSIPISSTKSMVGHPLGASGAIELITCLLAMERSFIPPTINYEVADPECDLDYVPNIGREAAVDIAMSNSFGFGGTNAILIARKWRDDE
ncbi:MAG: beta-ketoacyl-ACP synthase II [Candidatus Eisenbacteria bacterium]